VKFAEVEQLVRGIPYTTPERGREIYDHVLKARPEKCLELGFAHGVSLCYVAAALHELGRGHIDGVDLESVSLDPSPETLLARCGLSEFVTLHRERNSYTWFLKKKIEANSAGGICKTEYDLCYIDGPKNWTIDGAAFFMVDKLLNRGGAVVFDDYSYAYRGLDGTTDGVVHRELANDERLEPQIKAVFHLLVMQHPDYGKFEIVNEQWGWATKTGGTDRDLRVHERLGLWSKLMRRLRRVRQG
jgi:predicted O-methyltransferase YrrM